MSDLSAAHNGLSSVKIFHMCLYDIKISMSIMIFAVYRNLIASLI